MRIDRRLQTLLATAAVAAPAQLALAQHDAHAEGHDAHAVEAHEGHDAHTGHHAATWSDVDKTQLLGSFVNFGIWLALIVFLARKPLREFLTGRRRAVVEGIEEAGRVKAQAEAKYEEYSARIANLDAELARLRSEMETGGREEHDRIVAEAQRKAERMGEEARFLVEQQLKQLREELTRETIDAAVRAAENTLRTTTTPQDQERLARDYLATVRGAFQDKLTEKQS